MSKQTKNYTDVQIRAGARQMHKDLGRPNICVNCGYDDYIEICHIKPVKDFKKCNLVEINHPDNIVALCPNCHKQFDNGKITLEEILQED